MNILLLGFAKMKLMPYASLHLDQIDYKKNQVDMVYWNRDLRDEDLSGYDPSIAWHEFRLEMEDSIPKRDKLRHFHAYRRFVLDILAKRRFDKIIVLHTLPGLLVLDRLLSKTYRKKYIVDYRDSTFETNPLFKALVGRMVRGAESTFVSSDGFRRYLPERGAEILTTHNILADSLDHRDDRKAGLVKSDKIRIAFWGLLRHTEHNKLIIDRLANDPRFELHYYGREQYTGRELRRYCAEHGVANVFFHGEYLPADRYGFACQTDVIHNSYLDTNTLLAMGNKYYDGVIFRIPQLFMPGSYMAQRGTAAGIGIALDPREPDFADRLHAYWQRLDRQSFDTACDRELGAVMGEFDASRARIRALLNPASPDKR